MPYMQSETIYRDIKTTDHSSSMNSHESAPSIQIDNIEQALTVARPRLLRQAQRRGVSPDALDDVVQETLIEAWRHLNTLRTPDRFDAWLDGICRNMCLRWSQTHQRTTQRQTSLPARASEETVQDEDTGEMDIPDPFSFDPAEELSHQDLTILLDRALGYLPAETRKLIEMCYLAELPQREVALRLGLTIQVLEARLHRARRQLRQVLSSELHSEAQAFGLAIDNDVAEGWRESREWCWFCAQHRLLGRFEPMPGGLINFHMRCPRCSEVVGTGGYPLLEGLRSFRPALKRVWQAVNNIGTGLVSGQHPCPICGVPRMVRVLHPDEFAIAYPSSPNIPVQYSLLVQDCPACNIHVETIVEGILMLHPLIQRFMADYPRAILEPEIIVVYAEQPAIRMRLTDITSAARLTLLAHSRTLQVLATFQE